MRVLFAWELGANYGHLTRQLPVAQKLRAMDCEVLFAARELRAADAVLTPHEFRYVAAPHFTGRVRLRHPPANYAELLLAEGYGNMSFLVSQVRAWLNLMRVFSSDVIVIDHSPTALLASRIANIPAVALGNGFEIPPAVDPLPSIRPWENTDPRRLARAERFICSQMNRCLEHFGISYAFERMTDLFSCPGLIATFKELDHYPVRVSGNYIGPIDGAFSKRSESWRTERRKVFAYLRNPSPGIRKLIEAMKEIDAEIVCALPGIDSSQVRKLSTETFRIHEQAVQLQGLLEHADICVCHGGVGMVAQSLLSGVPLMLVPTNVEQYLQSTRVAELGAGIRFSERVHQTHTRALRTLLEESSFKANATKFSSQYTSFDSNRAVQKTIDEIQSAARVNKRNLH